MIKWSLRILLAAAVVAGSVALDRHLVQWGTQLDDTAWDEVGEIIGSTGQFVVPVVLLSAVAIAGAVRRRRALYRLVVRAAIVWALSGIIAQGMKASFGRQRPWIEKPGVSAAYHSRKPSFKSFPSSHATCAFALAAALSAGVGRWRRVIYGWAALVGASRLVVAAHWPSDVAAGAALGLALGHASRLFSDFPADRWFREVVFPPIHRPTPRRTHIVAAALLAAMAFALFSLRNNRVPLIGPDEPRSAQCAREMIASRDFVVPRFNGVTYAARPPLAYWTIGTAFILFGQDEFTARLPSALFGAAACLITYALGVRLFNRHVAFAGAAILACSLQVVWAAKSATADALVLALTLGALYGAARLLDGGRATRWMPVLYGCLGLSHLAVGPVGVGVVGLALVTFLAVTRDVRFLRRLHILPGLLIMLVINVPWLVLVQVRTGGEFLSRATTDRFLAGAFPGSGGYGAPFVVYVPLLAMFFFPWSILLPRALARFWRDRLSNQGWVFLLCWVAPGFLLFCVLGARAPQNLLPLYPALSLIVARRLLPDREADADALTGWFGRVESALLLLIAGIVAVGLPLVLWVLEFPIRARVAAVVPGLLLVAGAAGGVALMRRRHSAPALAALAVATYLAWMSLYHLTLRIPVRYTVPRLVAPALEACRDRGLPITTMAIDEPGLVWRMNGLVALNGPEGLRDEVERHGAVACLLGLDMYGSLLRDGRFAVTPVSRQRSISLATGKWVETWVVEVSSRSPRPTRPPRPRTAPTTGAAGAGPASAPAR